MASSPSQDPPSPQAKVPLTKHSVIKALREHRDPARCPKGEEAAYFFEEEVPSVPTDTHAALCFSHTEATRLGKRPYMEDTHFTKEADQGFVAGVFDGHGGKEVAERAVGIFEKEFFDELAKRGGDVGATFQALVDKTHLLAEKTPNQGATAVLCYFDRKTHLLYTATLGDSEAFLYRETSGGVFKALPLSCVRDWTCAKDQQRAIEAWKQPKGNWKPLLKGNPVLSQRRDLIDWPEEQFKVVAEAIREFKRNPKELRFSKGGPNFSRSIGDWDFEGAVSHKIKMTVTPVQPGDRVMLVSDGVTDYASQSQILKLVPDQGPSSPRLLFKWSAALCVLDAQEFKQLKEKAKPFEEWQLQGKKEGVCWPREDVLPFEEIEQVLPSERCKEIKAKMLEFHSYWVCVTPQPLAERVADSFSAVDNVTVLAIQVEK